MKQYFSMDDNPLNNPPQQQNLSHTSTSELNSSPQNQVDPKPAGAWSRFFAWFIDLLILPWLTIVPLFLLEAISRIITGSWESPPFTWAYLAITFIIYLTYSIYLTSNKGATWGKNAYGLVVVKFGTNEHISYKRALVRELFRALALIPAIGLFIDFVNIFAITFSSQKRAIHDIVAGTQVLKMNKPWSLRKQLIIFGLMLIGGVIFILLGKLFNQGTSPAQGTETFPSPVNVIK